MSAHTSGMHVQPVFTRTHASFLRTRLCSVVHMDTRSNMCTHARTLHMYAWAYVRMLALKNLNFHYFDLFSPMSLSRGNSHVLFSYFCRSHPLFQVGVALVTSLLGTGPWLMTQRPWCAQPALSPSSVCFRRVLLVPSWCSRWLRGGGTLPTPSTLLRGRWQWLPMISIRWSAFDVMGHSLICRLSRVYSWA